MKLTLYQKQFEIKAAGVEITPDLLTIVNRYTLKELTAEDIYIRKFIMAHNAVDRDNERFSETLLNDFSKTLPGKSFLIGHDRSGPGVGLYFDANTEEMTPEQFIALTKEIPRLPENVSTVKILWGWVYLVKAQFNEEMITNMDAGIYRHASIGFRASDLTPVKGQYDNILYWEYVSPGEALEGSIVWLGAQPGATAQKRHDEKGAVSFSPTTPADEGRAWDAGAAKGRLAKWASEDGSGDKDTIDWPKYRKGFTWYDSENPENFGSYKLPHHDVIDGEIVVIWKGVAAAMTALMGGRGGVDIPDSEWDTCYNHLAKHYKQFEKEPPEKALNTKPEKGGKKKMEEFLKRLSVLFPGKSFKEEGLEEEIKAAIDEKINSAVTDAKAPLEAEIKTLKPLAEEGKAYREDLVNEYVSMKAKLGEVGETPEAQDELRKIVEIYPLDFLKAEVTHLQKRVEEKFPDEPQTKGDDRRDKSKEGDKEKENKLKPEEEK